MIFLQGDEEQTNVQVEYGVEGGGQILFTESGPRHLVYIASETEGARVKLLLKADDGAGGRTREEIEISVVRVIS